MDYSICLATTGAGLWTSHDSGKSWLLSRCDRPKYPYELCARAVASTAARPGEVWAAIDGEHGEDVVARSVDGGETYAFAAVPAPGRQIWALAIDPFTPDTMLAGSRQAGLYRSTDGGATWPALATGVAEAASIGHTRVTSIRHTQTPGEIWVSVEIGGLLHSTDGGDTWEQIHTAGGQALLGPDEVWTDERHFDMHDVAVGQTASGQPGRFRGDADRLLRVGRRRRVLAVHPLPGRRRLRRLAVLQQEPARAAVRARHCALRRGAASSRITARWAGSTAAPTAG